MSAATKLAQLRLTFRIEELEVLATPCARCGHPFARHEHVGERCRYPQWSHEPGPKCKCRSFEDAGPQSERLPI